LKYNSVQTGSEKSAKDKLAKKTGQATNKQVAAASQQPNSVQTGSEKPPKVKLVDKTDEDRVNSFPTLSPMFSGLATDKQNIEK
jgi:hypothetical protein